jgi:LysM repeat protein
MTDYYVAIDHPESPDPESPVGITTTYLGVVDQAHVDEVRAIAELPDSERWVKEHPRLEGAFMVLRDDGDLDVYVPTDAAEYRVYAPDPAPKTKNLGGDLSDADLVQTASTAPLPRGVSGPAYISGVTRFGDQSIGGAMDYPSNPARAVWHTTESPAGASYFLSVGAYLIRVASEPQVIYDPVSDKLGQFGPLTSSARALQNDGARRTNREGRVCIQVEVLGRAASPWTNGFNPADKPNFRKLLAAMRAHGIPDVWPAGAPLATAAAVAKKARNRTTWQSKGGHFSHGQVPNNSHWDPGAIDISIVPGKAAVVETGGNSGPAPQTPSTYTVKKGDTLTAIADKYDTTVAKLVSLNGLKDADDLAVGQKLKLPGKAPAAPRYEPFPGAGFFHGGRHSPIITAMGRRLVAEGCAVYRTGPGPNWTNADRESYRRWQKKLGYSRDAADGIPGKKSWDALKVPNV